MKTGIAAIAASLAVLGGGVYVVNDQLHSESATAVTEEFKACDSLGGAAVDDRICLTVGFLPVSLYNLQAAKQFCAWRNANPGAWMRLKAYSATGADPSPNNTFFGAHIKNVIETYRFNGLTDHVIAPFSGANAC